MAKAIFVTGTGTDVGKTYVTGLLLKKMNEMGKKAAYYKAAMSGNERDSEGNLIPGDAVSVKETSGIGQPLAEMCPYIYENAYSPHLASRIEGGPVEMDVVRAGYDEVCRKYDYVVMEGSGGILCPIRCDDVKIQLEDIVRAFELPDVYKRQLADYAQKQPSAPIGRLQLIREGKDNITGKKRMKRLDLAKSAVRAKVMSLRTAQELDSLFLDDEFVD